MVTSMSSSPNSDEAAHTNGSTLPQQHQPQQLVNPFPSIYGTPIGALPVPRDQHPGQPHGLFGETQHLNTGLYGSLGGLGSPGYPYSAFTEDMKRALDTSSLPVNPLTGATPSIDSSSSFENNGAQTATGAANKRPRHSPLPVNTSTPFNAVGGAHYTPTQQNFHPHAHGMAPHTVAAAPLHLGGPIHGAQSPMGTPNVGPPGSARMNGHSLTVPNTPIMNMNGMMNMPMSPFGYNMNYPVSPIMSPSMNPGLMTGNYGPAAAAAAAAAAGNSTGRTVYVGNLPAEASVDELLNLVRFGPIEQIRLIPERSCVFISFMDGSTAAGFHADAQVKKLALHGQELRIGWGKASSVPRDVHAAVLNQSATRNVFVGNLADSITEQDLRDALSKFGPIDQVKIVRDKNIGFVHFLSIATAMKVVAQLPTEPGWEDKRVYYGKDRCAYVPKAQQAAVQAAQNQALAAVQAQHANMPGTPFTPFTPMSPGFGGLGTPITAGFGSPIMATGFGGMGAAAGGWMDPSQMGNRTVYLGNIAPETTTEELCNNIRGGMLERVKHIAEKGIAFITFIEAESAMALFKHATSPGLTINSRRLKAGWGTKSGPMTPALLQAVQAGATRNVYIGSVSDWDSMTEAKLREDFGEFGEIEMINFLKDKGAAFLNFTSIHSAQKAIEGVKTKAPYSTLRVAYGKDRCANAPRAAGTGQARPLANRTPSGTVVPTDTSAGAVPVAETGAFDEDDGMNVGEYE